MSKQFARIEQIHRAFILRQHMFFTASAAQGSRVNVSPRSTDALRILDANRVAISTGPGVGTRRRPICVRTGVSL